MASPATRSTVLLIVVGFVAVAIYKRSQRVAKSRLVYLDLNGEKLPTYYMYKQSLLMPIRNQAACASCWSFSIADMTADSLNLRSGGAYGMNPLSAQYLLSCSTAHYGCDIGASPEDIYDLPQVTEIGLPLDSVLPYTAQVDACRLLPQNTPRVRLLKNTAIDICQDPGRALPWMKQFIIEQNVRNMKMALMTYGPIVGTLRVHQDLYAYKGQGVYAWDSKSAFVGFHSICIIGWCDESVKVSEKEFDGAYWKCRSSWGGAYGAPAGMCSGFIYVKMGCNEIDVESRASVAHVEIPKYLEEAVKGRSIRASANISYTDTVDDAEQAAFIHTVMQKQ